jgi:hypothetical protein
MNKEVMKRIRILLLWDVRRISTECGSGFLKFRVFPAERPRIIFPDKKGSFIGGVNGQVIDTFLTTGCIAVE